MADGLGRSFDALPLASPFGDLDPLGLVLGRFDGAAAACGSDGGAWFIGLGLGVGVRVGVRVRVRVRVRVATVAPGLRASRPLPLGLR